MECFFIVVSSLLPKHSKTHFNTSSTRSCNTSAVCMRRDAHEIQKDGIEGQHIKTQVNKESSIYTITEALKLACQTA